LPVTSALQYAEGQPLDRHQISTRPHAASVSHWERSKLPWYPERCDEYQIIRALSLAPFSPPLSGTKELIMNSNNNAGKLPEIDDFVTHRTSWRAALVIARDFGICMSADGNSLVADESGLVDWERALHAYDRAFSAYDPGSIPDEFAAHRSFWRYALEHARDSNSDADDKAYWVHELSAFDRAFQSINVDRKLPQVSEKEVAEVKAAGYQVHQGGTDDGTELNGRWWWTLSRPGWMEALTAPGDFDDEAAAWADAVRFHLPVASFERKVNQALQAASGLKVIFSSMLQDRSQCNAVYHAHSGQQATIIGVGIDPAQERWDEEALPFLKVRFEDGVEIEAFGEELFSTDERFFALYTAVLHGYGAARDFDACFFGPYHLESEGSDADKQAYLAALNALEPITECDRAPWTPKEFRIVMQMPSV
jgi:hypothetical protein